MICSLEPYASSTPSAANASSACAASLPIDAAADVDMLPATSGEALTSFWLLDVGDVLPSSMAGVLVGVTAVLTAGVTVGLLPAPSLCNEEGVTLMPVYA